VSLSQQDVLNLCLLQIDVFMNVLRSVSPTVFLTSLGFLWFGLIGVVQGQSTAKEADRIVAIVNDQIILKSEVDQELAQYIQQVRLQGEEMSFSESLWKDALESMIDNKVMLIQAQKDSVVVTNEQVNRQMDVRVQELIQQAGSETALERAFGKSVAELRREFREPFRQQLVVSQLQSQVMGQVTITRPEVEAFFATFPEDSLPTIPEQVALSQIVLKPEVSQDARRSAFDRAAMVRERILSGESFEEMAKEYSDGPSGPRGGLIPMLPLSDLVSEYAAAASALQPGEISEVVETSFGFHVIRLNKKEGNRIETNNILISIDQATIDEQGTIDSLMAIREKVQDGLYAFSDAARAYSEDDESSNAGGRLYNAQTGDRFYPLRALDPATYRTVLLLDEEGDISEPKPIVLPDVNETQAFRILRLDQRIEEHTANLEQDYQRIEQIALQQKQTQELTAWLNEIREEVYIEYIGVPEALSSSR
jgi:peptidyl-prolyl cis-trans isomerase SurA